MEDTTSAIIHFYRATMEHSDMWRQRLDTTTNWAVVTSVGVISFTFSSVPTPHFILLMLLVVNSFFLLMESRRYQLYDVWQARLDVLHRYYFTPALTDYRDTDEELSQAKLSELGENLGETVPRMSIVDALGLRIRRHYLYIFLVTIGAWTLKIYIHPMSAAVWSEYVQRATVGVLGGTAVILLVLAFSVVAFTLAARAPSEYMVDWAEQPSPISRLWAFRWFYDPTAGEPLRVYPDHGRERAEGGVSRRVDGGR